MLSHEFDEGIAMSSANVTSFVIDIVGKSLVYSKYKKGRRTLPWGTPAMIGKGVDFRYYP